MLQKSLLANFLIELLVNWLSLNVLNIPLLYTWLYHCIPCLINLGEVSSYLMNPTDVPGNVLSVSEKSHILASSSVNNIPPSPVVIVLSAKNERALNTP